jgi:hypothetical protein
MSKVFDQVAIRKIESDLYPVFWMNHHQTSWFKHKCSHKRRTHNNTGTEPFFLLYFSIEMKQPAEKSKLLLL